MASYTEAKRNYYKGQVVATVGNTTADLERQFLLEYFNDFSTYGKLSNAELLFQYFTALGFTQKTLAEKWYAYLVSEGYTGPLRQMQKQFFEDNT